jgi:hypothetical protein
MFFSSDQLNKVNINSLSSFNIVDPFSLDYDDKQYIEFTDAEIVAAKGSTLVFDCESYWNYFLASFKCPITKKLIIFESDYEAYKDINLQKLKWVCENFCIVGFNSFSYDVPVLAACLLEFKAHEIKQLSNSIIYENYHRKQIEEEIRQSIDDATYKLPVWNHIDLIEVAPLSASLKLYSGRLHAKQMQELDIDPEKELTEQEKKVVKFYNINDLDNTELLMKELIPALDLRTQLSIEYNQDLRSKSDAQIAEAVIGSELIKINGYWPKKNNIASGTILKYETPSWMKFETPELQELLKLVQDTNFFVGDSGGPEAPKDFKPSVTIGESTYKIGIGGLHSTESCISHKATDDMLLCDRDVSSYYPAIILNLGLFPQHLGKNFLRVYKSIVNRRLEAKKAGNKIVNQSLKITINGTFGKLGNRWSILYAPDRIIQVLMTGQLALLMLIETLYQCGVQVVSGNTDGVLIKCPKDMYARMVAAVIYWEKLTGFETEETQYKAIYQRDVNNFIAVKLDDTVKVKGCYAEKGSSGDSVLSKNPENLIVSDSITAYLTKQIPIADSITNCTDIRRFVTVRNVKGGGVKSGVYLGKSVRWYYSTAIQGEINYKSNGNKVPNTENAMPLMTLPDELPDDIDYDRYIKIALDTLKDIGYYSNGKQNTGYLF